MKTLLFIPALLTLCITATALRAAEAHNHSAPAAENAKDGCHATPASAKEAGGCCMKPAAARAEAGGCCQKPTATAKEDHGCCTAPAAAAAVRPYPLDTCPVSGEKLGAHGKPVVFTDGTREVKLCCASCEGDWKKDREALLKKLDAADAAKAAPAKP